MSATWVLVPGTPILLPGVAGIADPAAPLRATCAAAIGAALASPPTMITIVAGADQDQEWPDDPYDLGRLIGGGAGAGAEPLPLALAVGRSLVRAAGWDGPTTLRTITGGAVLPGEVVVAVGDGSLYRHEKGGPGPQDPRSAPFDAAVTAALSAGDPDTLAALLDGPEAAELGVTGRRVWRALAASAGRPVTAAIDLAADPFGPFAIVGRWCW